MVVRLTTIPLSTGANSVAAGVTLEEQAFAAALINNRIDLLTRVDATTGMAAEEATLAFDAFEGKPVTFKPTFDANKKLTAVQILVGDKPIALQDFMKVITAQGAKLMANAMSLPEQYRQGGVSRGKIFSAAGLAGNEGDATKLGMTMFLYTGLSQAADGSLVSDGVINPSRDLAGEINQSVAATLNQYMTAAAQTPAANTQGDTTQTQKREVEGSKLTAKALVDAKLLPAPDTDANKEKIIKEVTPEKVVEYLTKTNGDDKKPLITAEEAKASHPKAARDKILARIGMEELTPRVDKLIGADKSATLTEIFTKIVEDENKLAHEANKEMPAADKLPPFIAFAKVGIIDVGAAPAGANTQADSQQTQQKPTGLEAFVKMGVGIGEKLLDRFVNKQPSLQEQLLAGQQPGMNTEQLQTLLAQMTPEQRAAYVLQMQQRQALLQQPQALLQQQLNGLQSVNDPRIQLLMQQQQAAQSYPAAYLQQMLMSRANAAMPFRGQAGIPGLNLPPGARLV